MKPCLMVQLAGFSLRPSAPKPFRGAIGLAVALPVVYAVASEPSVSPFLSGHHEDRESFVRARAPIRTHAPLSRWFEIYNDVERKSWWKKSAPHSFEPAVNADSPRVEACKTAGEHSVPLFLSGHHEDRESFVRVINRSHVGEHEIPVWSETIEVHAIDDSGWEPPPMTLTIAAEGTIHLNSSDIEDGNASKGLTGATGSPVRGDWRLRFVTILDIEVLAYVRTGDGMLASMLDTVSRDDDGYRVPMFNPGRNTKQVSELRLVNPCEEEAGVTIRGVDDSGDTPGTPVTFTIPGGSARSFTARELEGGFHDDVDVEGALGAGEGKWRLTVVSDTPLQVINLLRSPTGHMTNLSTTPRAAEVATDGAVPRVEYMPPDADPVRQGFVRVVNHGAESGTVNIAAFDDSGQEYGPAELTIEAHQAVHFNSGDLEAGNADKGLPDGVGAGAGPWRLELASDLDIEVLSYIRTADGFLTSVHDLGPRAVHRHRVSTFNPGSNVNQVSRLRIINPDDEAAEVTITGIDERGEAGERATEDEPGTGVELTVPPRSVRTLTAQELESEPDEGAGTRTGTIGDGTGKWQLIVAADRPIRVMSLMESPTGHLTNLSTRPPIRAHAPPSPYFETYNDLEAKSWWKESEPYSCEPAVNGNSPWVEAGMADLGGSDPLSLIRYYGNGSYVRYGAMGFHGCTRMWKYPNSTTHLDTPADPAYYTLGDIDIFVDIARVPEDAEGWSNDDGNRVDMSMAATLQSLNDHVAPYWRKLSEGKFRITFVEGEDFEVGDDGSPAAMQQQLREILGFLCDDYPCSDSSQGAANRMVLPDVENYASGRAWNGNVQMGLVLVRDKVMETIVHEMGHAWPLWAHSYLEIMWIPNPGDEPDLMNPYSNRFDFMSSLGHHVKYEGWNQNLPATLAVNRYAAGWIDPEHVALHLTDEQTYRLRKPLDGGLQFLVVHSGRRYAFTTLEVVDDRDRYLDLLDVWDPSAPGGSRPFNVEGVLVSRYDQTTGTGAYVRLGPAVYNVENPNAMSDVGWGGDDHSLIVDGDSRDLGNGVVASVSRNPDGSYDVTLAGGTVAEFEQWCQYRYRVGVFDTGCLLDNPR